MRMLALVAVLSGLVPALAAQAHATAKPPNIVFVFSDDHAAHAIGAYGSKLNATPALDRLAREGVRFANCFCGNSICGPSRATVLTGKHSHANGFRRNDDRFDGGQTTFPKLLQAAGYTTAMIGKWHLDSDPTGFDHWEVLPGQGEYYNPDFLSPAGRRRIEGHATEITTELAIEWLETRRDPNKPFLLMCQHKAPHRPWQPALADLELFRDGDLPRPATLFDDFAGRGPAAAQHAMGIDAHMHMGYDLHCPLGDDEPLLGAYRAFRERLTAAQLAAWDTAFEVENEALREAALTGRALVEWKYQRYIKNYLRCVAGVDRSVGALLEWLEENGLAENTVFVYSSDQGFYLGEHGWYDKRWMYEESLRMPLLVRWPARVPAGRVVEALAQNIDFAPTVLEIAGVARPADLHGESLVPFLEGRQPERWRDAIYYQYHESRATHNVAAHYGVRTDRHKLIRFWEPEHDYEELFDLREDPNELRNVIDEPRYAAVRAELTAKLAALHARYGAQDPAEPPAWIWLGEAPKDAERWLRRSFAIDAAPRAATLWASGDDSCTVWINGVEVLDHDEWESPAQVDVGSALRAGTNVIAVRARNDAGAAAFACRLAVDLGDGRRFALLSDESWRASSEAAEGWSDPAFDDSAWQSAESRGRVGERERPWSSVGLRLFGVPAPAVPPQRARRDDSVTAPAGFVVERLWDVPRTQGSWVSLAKDPRGRLYASDQERGLFRITPAAFGDPGARTAVEAIDVPLGGAQGLLWAFDALYAVVNGRDSGLYRLRDRDGDDRLDLVEKLRALNGSGEHGPHAIVLAPHGRSLFVIAGNHTDLPEVAASRLPRNWGDDVLLPQRWDPGGHARGRRAPGGWVCEVDPDGERWELWAAGMRNAYDIAFDTDGELFTWDADMEWDLGLPWYRPTRICQLVSGAEFGWRSGSAKWPAHRPDSVTPVLEMGPGSPTGVVFGTGARFPARYQQALFVLDWTFGTIWAVHLLSRGAGYTAEAEEFVTGQPLALTDAVVGDDGALYFTIGGRGTESVLYRVVWTGEEPRAVTALPDGEAGAARALRRELEAFHGRIDPRAVEAAWPHLRSPDRAVRYAARLAIEAQPLASWRERAHGEREPRAACDALLALARHGAPESLGALLAAAARIEWAGADRELRLDLLRVLQLACIRMGAADAAQRRAWLARLEPLFPSGDDAIDGELVELLVFLDAPSVVARALPLLRERRVTPPPDWAGRLARNDRYGGTIRRLLDEPPPTGGMRYAWALRNVRYGWTPDQRAEFFAFLDAAAKHSGGESFRGYIDGMRDDALANCSAAERERFAPRAEDADAQPAEIVPARGPGRTWTVDAALAAVGDKLSGRDFDRGRELYRAAACASCHRFDGEGGSVGPDLSSVRARFSMRDLLEAIIEPSKIVSDQYAASVVETSSGDLLVGRVVEIDDATFEVRPGDPALPVQRVRRADVASTRRSEISPMPSALLNVLNPDELRDLIAYVLSGGNRSSPMFAK